MDSRIYLDNNGSTAIDPRVLKVVVNNLQSDVGNSLSVHSFGQETRNHVAKARRTVADFLGVKSQEIIFTSGGTEALNMVIRGLLPTSGHIISSSVEHAAVFNTLKALNNEVTFLSPGLWGAISPDALQKAIRPDTKLIVLMAVNNETGVKTDIHAMAAIASAAGIPFVVDAIALLGKEEFTIPAGVSAMCFSGHKIHAPKGIGAAFVRGNVKLKPLLFGGPQEQQFRAGTENVSGIMGFAEAIAILKENQKSAITEMTRLRDRFEQKLKEALPNIIINGQGPRVSNTSNISFVGVDGESLLMKLDRLGVAASHGSACISGALEPSRTLLNMGISMSQVRSTLRFSLSRMTTQDEIDRAVDIILSF